MARLVAQLRASAPDGRWYCGRRGRPVGLPRHGTSRAQRTGGSSTWRGRSGKPRTGLNHGRLGSVLLERRGRRSAVKEPGRPGNLDGSFVLGDTMPFQRPRAPAASRGRAWSLKPTLLLTGALGKQNTAEIALLSCRPKDRYGVLQAAAASRGRAWSLKPTLSLTGALGKQNTAEIALLSCRPRTGTVFSRPPRRPGGAPGRPNLHFD